MAEGGRNMYFLIVAIIGYLFGCVHGSQIVGKYKHFNIKKSGMKNDGAINNTVLLGCRYGFIVAFIDIFKAIMSLLIISSLLNKFDVAFDVQIIYLYINALFVIIGHNFPLTMNFNGGKGTASLFGILLYIDWRFAVMGLFILLLFAFVTNYFVTGTFILYISFAMYTLFLFGRAPTVIAILFILLFFIKHAEN